MFKKFALVAPIITLGFFVSIADANHSWGGYHWARTAAPFTLQLGDNVSNAWDSYLVTASKDWNVSEAFDTVVKPGNTRPRRCAPTAGRVEVCNEKFGNNGWLGIAQVWVTGDHITQGTVKMNDTYFSTRTYNTPAWKNFVMCQEIGHTFGLDHQDENFSNENLGTCMDYTNNPSTNQHPNQHDYDMLTSIYAHLDSNSTLLGSGSGVAKGNSNEKDKADEVSEKDLMNPGTWGKEIHHDEKNHASLHKRDLGNGTQVFTFVTWAQ